jgi:hypothetical protein
MAFTPITAESITDHAGAYYSWFDDVVENPDGSLWITAVAEYMVGEDGLRVQAVVTPAELRQAVEIMRKRTTPGTYAHKFYSDLIFGRLDEADGDMNTVDCILQTAMWGEPVFA